MVRDASCPKCRSGKEKEVIKGGMEQVVHWDAGYVVREETTYEKNLRHSNSTATIKLVPIMEKKSDSIHAQSKLR